MGVSDIVKDFGNENLKFETPTGYIILEGPISAKVLKNLKLDPTLNAFRNYQDQEKALFEILTLPEARIFIARHENTIVGYVTFHRPDESQRWSQPDLPNVLELGGIEVASKWRNFGIAKRILKYAFENKYFDDKIVFSNEFAWHWDLDSTNLKVWQYRDLMERLFSSVGFDPWATDEPDIISHPANMFSVKIGKDVASDTVERFKGLCILGIDSYY